MLRLIGGCWSGGRHIASTAKPNASWWPHQERLNGGSWRIPHSMLHLFWHILNSNKKRRSDESVCVVFADSPVTVRLRTGANIQVCQQQLVIKGAGTAMSVVGPLVLLSAGTLARQSKKNLAQSLQSSNCCATVFLFLDEYTWPTVQPTPSVSKISLHFVAGDLSQDSGWL